MANIRLATTSKQDEQRKRLHKAGMIKGAIDARAIEIGLNKMIADLDGEPTAELSLQLEDYF